ncbi:MAG: sterol desaturase family protein [Alphaproteobacteria bacterium]|nr:sterol desaturase family protein [Alphaproteobacteria bacterium]
MTDALAQAFADPLLISFILAANAVSVVAFAVFAVPLTWLAWRAPAWAERWRIQGRPFQVDRWLGPSLGRWAVNSVAMLAVSLCVWPLLRPLTGVHTGPLPPVWLAAGQLLLFVYVDDALYWLMHRAMHEGWLYRRIHAVHHRIPTPFAATGHYMHPVEYVATGLLMLAGPVVVGAHVAVVYAWVVLRQLEAAEGHCGYHLPISPWRWLPGGHGPEHHDFHHSRFHGNYSGFLGWLDVALGTEARGYAAHRAAGGVRGRADQPAP